MIILDSRNRSRYGGGDLVFPHWDGERRQLLLSTVGLSDPQPGPPAW